MSIIIFITVLLIYNKLLLIHKFQPILSEIMLIKKMLVVENNDDWKNNNHSVNYSTHQVQITFIHLLIP